MPARSGDTRCLSDCGPDSPQPRAVDTQATHLLCGAVLRLAASLSPPTRCLGCGSRKCSQSRWRSLMWTDRSGAAPRKSKGVEGAWSLAGRAGLSNTTFLRDDLAVWSPLHQSQHRVSSEQWQLEVCVPPTRWGLCLLCLALFPCSHGV